MQNLNKKVEISDLVVSYANKQVLKGITLDVYENEILSIIGPAQSGKTTLLKVINRTLDFIPQAKINAE